VSEIVVRDAKLEDARAIAQVRNRTWQVAYVHIFPAEQLETTSEDRAEEWWRAAIENPAPQSHTLVADDAGEVVGFASLGLTRDELEDPERVGELFAIYVSSEAWGEGLDVRSWPRL